MDIALLDPGQRNVQVRSVIRVSAGIRSSLAADTIEERRPRIRFALIGERGAIESVETPRLFEVAGSTDDKQPVIVHCVQHRSGPRWIVERIDLRVCQV